MKKNFEKISNCREFQKFQNILENFKKLGFLNFSNIWKFRKIKNFWRENQKFRVFVLLPLLPGFEGQIGTTQGLALQAMMHWTFHSICRGAHSLFWKLEKESKNFLFKLCCKSRNYTKFFKNSSKFCKICWKFHKIFEEFRKILQKFWAPRFAMRRFLWKNWSFWLQYSIMCPFDAKNSKNWISSWIVGPPLPCKPWRALPFSLTDLFSSLLTPKPPWPRRKTVFE